MGKTDTTTWQKIYNWFYDFCCGVPQSTEIEEILTLRISKAPADNIMAKCDQVCGLFIATKSFDKSME